MTRRAVLLCSLLAAAPVRALDFGGALALHGFGEWGYGKTNGNSYLTGNKDGKFDNGEFGLNLQVNITQDVVAFSQLAFPFGESAGVDWAFIEWRVQDALRVRAGKVKQPFGISNEVEAIGTLRPFFSLPQALYGPGNFRGDSYLGVGLTGVVNFDSDWGLDYHVYGGSLHTPILPPREPEDTEPSEPENEETKYVAGARVRLLTPIDGLTFSLTGYTGSRYASDITDHPRINVGGASLEYLTERISLRIEAFRQVEVDHEGADAAYVELAYFLTDHLQLAGRAELSEMTDYETAIDDKYLRHRELAVGVNWWFTRDIVVKASYHNVYGNRFALPEIGESRERTHLFVLGTQFSF